MRGAADRARPYIRREGRWLAQAGGQPAAALTPIVPPLALARERQPQTRRGVPTPPCWPRVSAAVIRFLARALAFAALRPQRFSR